MKRQEWIERYKNDMIKKADIPENIAKELAEEAFKEFKKYTPEASVDSELSYWDYE